MKQPVRFFVPALLLAVLFALSACSPSSTVRLLRSTDVPQIPAPTAPNIAVVQLKDARPNSYIGVRRDNTPFIPNDAVPEWVARSLADALARQGLRVTYAQTLEAARAGGQPQYVVQGELQELWLRENSSTDMSASVKVFISLTGPKGRLFNEGMTSSLSKQGLPSKAAAEELLYNTVQDLVQSAAHKTQQAIAAQR